MMPRAIDLMTADIICVAGGPDPHHKLILARNQDGYLFGRPTWPHLRECTESELAHACRGFLQRADWYDYEVVAMAQYVRDLLGENLWAFYALERLADA